MAINLNEFARFNSVKGLSDTVCVTVSKNPIQLMHRGPDMFSSGKKAQANIAMTVKKGLIFLMIEKAKVTKRKFDQIV